MEETITNSSPEEGESSGVSQVDTMTTAPEHVTNIPPDASRTTETIYQNPNDPPLYEKLEKYREGIQHQHEPMPQDEFLEKVQRIRDSGRDMGFKSDEMSEPPAFDFNRSFGEFLSKPDDGALPILQNLYSSNQPAYSRFLSDAVLTQPEYVKALLAEQGYIPAHLVQAPSGVDPADPWIGDLRPDLQQIALSLDSKTWEAIAIMEPDVRDRELEEKAELQRFKQQEEQRQQREYEQVVEKAQQAWVQGVQDFAREFDGHAYAHMAKNFQPYTEAAANEKAHAFVMQATIAQADQNLIQMRQQVSESLARAADAGFHGRGAEARQHVLAARKIATRANAEFTRLLDANIEQFNLFFQHAQGHREAPAEDIERPAARAEEYDFAAGFERIRGFERLTRAAQHQTKHYIH